LFLLLLVFAHPLYANGLDAGNETDCFSTHWPHELSTLETDPSLFFGRLPNGFRYVLKTNSEPKDRVGIFLNVQAGSLHEADDQTGLAHFLEHMLFNGTTHFKPGELVDYFQSIGMSFGGDTNAYTTYEETVYKLILPKGDQLQLEKGLLVASDYARGALLLESEIDRERGVILAEKTARDSAAYRAHKAGTAFSFEGTLLPERMVIGDEQTLLQAQRDDLKSFYDAWYRPENMILVVVGDFEFATINPLIKKYFKNLQGTGPAPSCPDYGDVLHSGVKPFYHYDPELGYVDISIEVLWNKQQENDSFEMQKNKLYRYMAAKILNYRLDQIAEQKETPFTSASYYTGTMLDEYQFSGIRARTDQDNWQQALGSIEQVVKQALRYGFSDGELQRVKKELLSDLEDAVKTQNTRNSLALAHKIVRHLNKNRVLQSPSQERALYVPVIEEVTTDLLEDTITADWQRNVRLIEVIGDAQLPEKNAETAIKGVYARYQKTDVSPFEQNTFVDFPYLQVAERAMLPIRSDSFEEIGTKRFNFGNGIILNIKKTEFKEESVAVSVNFGAGKKSATHSGIASLTEAVINGSGTAQLKRSQLDKILAGSSVRYNFRVGEDSFAWHGRGIASDSELIFQVLQAVILDPVIRQDVYEVAMKKFDLMFRQFETDIQGGVTLQLDPFFAGNNISHGLPDWQSFKNLTITDISNWYMPQLNHMPLEISVVGDVDEQQIQDLTARYFVQSPARLETVEDIVEPRFPVGEELEVVVASSVDKAVTRLAWKTDDFWDIKRTRKLHVLAEILEDRLRKVVREKLGVSYSPKVYSTSSRVYKGYGMLTVDIVTENGVVSKVYQAVEEVVDSLVTNPVTREELDRAKGPLITSLKDAVRTNEYWLYSVLSLSARYPQQLIWPKTLIEDFASVSPEDIDQLVSMYLTPERLAVGIVRSSVKG